MEGQDLSNLIIDERGCLMIINKNGVTYKEVTGIRPSLDITNDILFDEFLGLITAKNFDEALLFTFKY